MNNVYLLWDYDPNESYSPKILVGVFSTQKRAIDYAEDNEWDSSDSIWIDIVDPDNNKLVSTIHMYPSNGEDMTPTWIDNDGKVIE